MDEAINGLLHEPVMVREVGDFLRPQPGQTILDCTAGSGGHSGVILEKIQPGGLLVGIDKDSEILRITKQRLTETGHRVKLYHADYADVDEVLRQAGVEKVHGVLLDLGASSFQFDRGYRGFSFSKNGTLDMRMDQTQGITAQELIQKLSVQDLAKILWEYGEERWSKRIARAIVKARETSDIASTGQLAEIVARAVPGGKGKIHPATKVFQALRIAVNRELESLEAFLGKVHGFMFTGARIVVISFHSLEDRLVKKDFLEKANRNIFELLTKKPVTPGDSEIEMNVRSRSAKLRAAERI